MLVNCFCRRMLHMLANCFCCCMSHMLVFYLCCCILYVYLMLLLLHVAYACELHLLLRVGQPSRPPPSRAPSVHRQKHGHYKRTVGLFGGSPVDQTCRHDMRSPTVSYCEGVSSQQSTSPSRYTSRSTYQHYVWSNRGPIPLGLFVSPDGAMGDPKVPK